MRYERTEDFMMINEIGSISSKNLLLNSIQGSAQTTVQGNNISGSRASLNSADKINGKPENDINGQNLKLKEACTQFEQIFIKYMVDKMWSSTDAGSGKQSTEKSMWQDYFNNEISKVIAESSMTGISETLFDQLGAFESVEEVLPVEDDAAAQAEAAGSGSEENMVADSEIII